MNVAELRVGAGRACEYDVVAIRDKVHAGMLAHGYTENDWHNFISIGAAMDALSGVVVSCHIMSKREHLPSARLGLETINYIKNANRWMCDALNKCGVRPEEIGMSGDPDHFDVSMAKFVDNFEQTIARANKKQEIRTQSEATANG